MTILKLPLSHPLIKDPISFVHMQTAGKQRAMTQPHAALGSHSKQCPVLASAIHEGSLLVEAIPNSNGIRHYSYIYNIIIP